MKKITALLLAAVLLLALCACGGKTAEPAKDAASAPTLPPVPTVNPTPEPTPEPLPSIAGYYKLTAMTKDGEIVEPEETDIDLGDFHFEIYLVLNEDGTGFMDMFGEQVDLTWDEKSIVGTDEETGEASPIGYTRDGDDLILEEEDEGMIFSPLTEDELAYYLENGSGSLDDFFSFNEFDYPEGEPTVGTVSGTIGDAYVTILGAEAIVDDDGDDAVRFWYEYTNQSDEISSAGIALFYDCWQDGEDLEYSWTYDNAVPEDDYSYLDILPGKTIRCTVIKKYNPEGGVVGFRLYDLWNDGSELYYYADPANMPGAPEDTFEFEVTGEIPDIMNDIYLNNEDVELTSFDLVKDWDGNDLIRVYFTYTNHTGEETSFGMNYSIAVFQDGYELEEGYPDESIDEDYHSYQDIPDGESIDCAESYLIRSGSPVVVIITNDQTDEMIGGYAELDE